ncbi:MAG: helix-turn-helix domain-containing protein [Ferrovum sp.]|nr:helix-turn-helix domain-containing protein [Ferrovum sp.]
MHVLLFLLIDYGSLSLMQIGNKFRCYPTAAQEQTLLQWIGCQRNIYHSKVREDQYFRRFARKSLQSELTPYLSDSLEI